MEIQANGEISDKPQEGWAVMKGLHWIGEQRQDSYDMTMHVRPKLQSQKKQGSYGGTQAQGAKTGLQ